MLTLADYALIRLQCEYQHATAPEDYMRFALAYNHAKLIGEHRRFRDPQEIEFLVRHLASFLDISGYADVPRVFADGTSAVAPALIPRAMKGWCEAFFHMDAPPNEIMTADELYQEFERIHPFVDGNGRVGHLMWAIATTQRTGSWPTTLPPEFAK